MNANGRSSYRCGKDWETAVSAVPYYAKHPAERWAALPVRLPSREKTVLHFVDQIYEAALEPAAWRPFLADLSNYFRSPTTAFVLHSITGRAATTAEWLGDGSGRDGYEAYYSRINPWWTAPSEDLFRPGAVLPGRSVLPYRDLRRTEFYADWGRCNGVAHTLGTLLAQTGSVFSYLSINRGSNDTEFTQDEIDLLKTLCPHLQRAIRLHERLSLATISMEALDRLPFGIALLRADRRVLLMNRVAVDIVNERDGIHYADNVLHFGRDSGALKSALAQVATKAWTSGGEIRETYTVHRGSGKRAYSVLISPVPSTIPLSPLQSERAVMLFITDPEREPQTAEDALGALFRLTNAEARLSLRLAAGLSLDAAADELGITRNTAKSQLRAVFEKTRTSRQGELVSLLLRSLPQSV